MAGRSPEGRRSTVVSRTTTLPARPEVAFAVLMSPETAPLIDPSVRAWAADRRPIGVGTRFAIRGRLGRLPFRGRSEVVAWEPPRGATFRTLSPRWPLSMTAVHELVPAGEETTYTWTVAFHEVHLVARPVIAVAARLFERALDRQAEALVAHLRSLPPGAPLPAL